MTHDPYTDVPKLFISSNSIRLLNVVGQGNLNGCVCLYFILGLSALAKAGSCDKEQKNTTGILDMFNDKVQTNGVLCAGFHFACKHNYISILCV